MSAFSKAFLAVLLPALCASAAEPPPATGDSAAITIESLTAAVPADAKLKTNGKWQPVGTARATEAMRAKGMKAQAEFKVKVAVLEPHPYNGHAICIHSKPVSVTINGTTLPYMVYIFFDSDGLESLGNTRVGDTISVSGIINKADIEVRGESAMLACELLRTRVKPSAPKR